MGMIGRYIDSRSDAEKDALIQHPDPTYDGGLWLEEWNGRECGCLVGTCRIVRGEEPEPPGAWSNAHPEVAPGLRFPALTERFGAPRIWRAVKLRAAKSYTPDLASQPQAQEAACS